MDWALVIHIHMAEEELPDTDTNSWLTVGLRTQGQEQRTARHTSTPAHDHPEVPINCSYF